MFKTSLVDRGRHTPKPDTSSLNALLVDAPNGVHTANCYKIVQYSTVRSPNSIASPDRLVVLPKRHSTSHTMLLLRSNLFQFFSQFLLISMAQHARHMHACHIAALSVCVRTVTEAPNAIENRPKTARYAHGCSKSEGAVCVWITTSLVDSVHSATSLYRRLDSLNSL